MLRFICETHGICGTIIGAIGAVSETCGLLLTARATGDPIDGGLDAPLQLQVQESRVNIFQTVHTRGVTKFDRQRTMRQSKEGRNPKIQGNRRGTSCEKFTHVGMIVPNVTHEVLEALTSAVLHLESSYHDSWELIESLK